MDYDTFDTDIFSEINDMPGEIYDIIEYKEEGEDNKKFDVEGYIKGNTDYWIHDYYQSNIDRWEFLSLKGN